MAYWESNGHVTDDVTGPRKVLWGSTVGCPSDSLASCHYPLPAAALPVNHRMLLCRYESVFQFLRSPAGSDWSVSNVSLRLLSRWIYAFSS